MSKLLRLVGAIVDWWRQAATHCPSTYAGLSVRPAKHRTRTPKGYRYALIGNYSMPAIADYKIPDELPEEDAQEGDEPVEGHGV